MSPCPEAEWADSAAALDLKSAMENVGRRLLMAAGAIADRANQLEPVSIDDRLVGEIRSAVGHAGRALADYAALRHPRGET